MYLIESRGLQKPISKKRSITLTNEWILLKNIFDIAPRKFHRFINNFAYQFFLLDQIGGNAVLRRFVRTKFRAWQIGLFDRDRDIFGITIRYSFRQCGRHRRGQFDGRHSPATEPAWSADGTKIIFVAILPDGNTDIYLMNANGTNRTNLSNTPLTNEANP